MTDYDFLFESSWHRRKGTAAGPATGPGSLTSSYVTTEPLSLVTISDGVQEHSIPPRNFLHGDTDFLAEYGRRRRSQNVVKVPSADSSDDTSNTDFLSNYGRRRRSQRVLEGQSINSTETHTDSSVLSGNAHHPLAAAVQPLVDLTNHTEIDFLADYGCRRRLDNVVKDEAVDQTAQDGVQDETAFLSDYGLRRRTNQLDQPTVKPASPAGLSDLRVIVTDEANYAPGSRTAEVLAKQTPCVDIPPGTANGSGCSKESSAMDPNSIPIRPAVETSSTVLSSTSPNANTTCEANTQSEDLLTIPPVISLKETIHAPADERIVLTLPNETILAPANQGIDASVVKVRGVSETPPRRPSPVIQEPANTSQAATTPKDFMTGTRGLAAPFSFVHPFPGRPSMSQAPFPPQNHVVSPPPAASDNTFPPWFTSLVQGGVLSGDSVPNRRNMKELDKAIALLSANLPSGSHVATNTFYLDALSLLRRFSDAGRQLLDLQEAFESLSAARKDVDSMLNELALAGAPVPDVLSFVTQEVYPSSSDEYLSDPDDSQDK